MLLIPYLNFNGECRQAFDFYRTVFGGEITWMTTYGESPMCAQMPPESHDLVMHCQLEHDGLTLMGADGPPPHDGGSRSVLVNLVVDTTADAERIFAALSEGGEVGMPMQETFWAHRFGMLVDRHGKPWMVNCLKPQ